MALFQSQIQTETDESLKNVPVLYYVPYSKLEQSPVTLHFGKLPIHMILASPSTCMVSVSSLFRITDTDSPGSHMSVVVCLGTSFQISYKGMECEVRLGRRIVIQDSDTYIHA